jgi:phosphopantothenoylcysteine synthetase/decarboxylase
VLDGHRTPGEPKSFPRPDAVILAPATFNTVNKLATGIADTYALTVLCSAIGTRTPMVIVPFVSTRLAGHPAWLASLAVLRYAEATLVDPATGRSTPTSHSTPGPAKR